MIDDLRAEIAEIDAAMLHLVALRLRLAKRIGHLKREMKAALVDKRTEDKVFARNRKLAAELGLDDNVALALSSFLIGEARKVQAKKLM